MNDQGPEKLYHYTSSDALVGIIRAKSLWFTDFRFLNDSKEFYFAADIVKNMLDSYDFNRWENEFRKATENNPQYDNPSYPYTYGKLVKKFKNKLITIVERNFYIENPDVSIPYVFSLSSSKDSLSQWRAYGRGEVCIEFDRVKLIEAVKGTQLLEVRYEKANAIDNDLTCAIDEFLVRKLQMTRRSGHLHPEVVFDGADDLRGFINRKLIPISMKHEGFSEESEWRLVCEIRPGIWRMVPDGAPHGQNQIECFFDQGRYPIPRAKVQIAQNVNQLSEIISCIVFGPGTDEKRARHSMGAINVALGTNFKVEISPIPYRR